ncbi:hypothetical protein A0E43_19370 [Pectobacterium cacticida]
MINFNAPFLHHFFQMAVAQRIGRIPADAHQDHIDWETHSFGIEHGRSTRSVDSRVAYDLGIGGQCDRTLARHAAHGLAKPLPTPMSKGRWLTSLVKIFIVD